MRGKLVSTTLALGALCFGAACEGTLGNGQEDDGSGDGTGDDGGDAPPATVEEVKKETEAILGATCAETGTDVGANVLRRLSRLEYQLTLQDLFHLPSPPAIDDLPADVVQSGFTSFSALQHVSPQHLRAYLDTVERLLAELSADPERFDEVVGCDPTAPACLDTFIQQFGRLAFRRALTPDEVTELTSKAMEFGSDGADQISYVIEALLVSPHFLFRLELGDKMTGLSVLSPGELAAKLSFTLWGRSPTLVLLDRAEAGELSTEEGLAEVALEMLKDPRAQSYYDQFFSQWLGYSELRAPIDPPADWSDELMPQMIEETDALLREYAWGEGMDFWDALTANRTTVAPELGAFYGFSPAADGSYEFQSAEPRAHAGLLGHASILSQKRDGDRVSVRGNWLRSTFLCQHLEVPPDLVETLGDSLVGLTSIEIIEKRNEENGCKGCHAQIDPIGVGLAAFDASGRFDETVDLSVYPIEPAFPDAAEPTFSSLAELAEKVRALPALTPCLTDRVFVYALGREPSEEDACAFEQAVETFAEESHRFSSLLYGLVVSEGFTLRKAPLAGGSEN